MSQIPEGWTDDMNIELPPERTLDDVVKFVVAASRNGDDFEKIARALVETLHLSESDAALAVDRVHGGVVRASTKNPANCPEEAKDPLAWISFQWATQDASIASDLYPQYSSPQQPAAQQAGYRHVSLHPGNTNAGVRAPWWRFWR